MSRYLPQIEQSLTMRGDMGVKAHIVVDTLLTIGEEKRARRFAEVAYAHGGGRLREATCAMALANVKARAGCWREAERLFEDAIRLASEIGARSVLAMAKLDLARLYAQRGEREQGVRLAIEARELSVMLGLDRYRIRAERLIEENAAGTEELNVASEA